MLSPWLPKKHVRPAKKNLYLYCRFAKEKKGVKIDGIPQPSHLQGSCPIEKKLKTCRDFFSNHPLHPIAVFFYEQKVTQDAKEDRLALFALQPHRGVLLLHASQTHSNGRAGSHSGSPSTGVTQKKVYTSVYCQCQDFWQFAKRGSAW